MHPLSRALSGMTDHHLRNRLQNAWDQLLSLPVSRRKQIILLCRAQCIIYNDEKNLLCIQTDLTQSLPSSSYPPEYIQYRSYLRSFHDFITSPYLSSIILDFCRSAPLSPADVKEQKLKSWGKEISVCERDERPLNFVYDCWFKEGCESTPLVCGLPPNPSMARKIRASLISWKRKLTRRVFFPRMSRKLVSRSTIRNWERYNGREWIIDEKDGGVEFTQETLEKIYHETGLQIEGGCEARQKWYRSGITPRTYFSQGGTAYKLSKYIQEMAGMLVEEFDPIHPILRLNPARVQLKDPSCYLRIYDLSSFTSNHWECKHFVNALAEWCMDTEIVTFDSSEGLVVRNLGQLISEYNQMNQFPEYSLEQLDQLYLELQSIHCGAGFLGVYGNINFSTALHGFSLAMAVNMTDEVNVAGDDAHFKQRPGEEWKGDLVIAANGLSEPTKEFRSDQIGAVCLKRGVIQEGHQVLPKIMVVFPSWSTIVEYFGSVIPQFQPLRLTKRRHQALVGSEIFRFLRAVHFYGQLTDDLVVIHKILSAIYVSFSFPRTGLLPPYSDILVPVLPDYPEDLTTCRPIDLLLQNHFSEGAVLPKACYGDELDNPSDLPLYSGGQWDGPMTRYLKHMGVLEYVVAKEQEEVVWGVEAYERIVDMYSGRLKRQYSFTCIRDVPEHLVYDKFNANDLLGYPLTDEVAPSLVNDDDNDSDAMSISE